MPKMKTHRGAAKRFKLTANGKLKYRRANRNHILTKKSSKRKRKLNTPGYMESGDAKNMIRILSPGL